MRPIDGLYLPESVDAMTWIDGTTEEAVSLRSYQSRAERRRRFAKKYQNFPRSYFDHAL
jgi:hypothetical protein